VAQLNPPTTGPSLQLIQKARTLYNQGQFAEAVPVLQQAVKAFETEGDKLNQAMALSNLAASLAGIQEWESATAAITSSLSIVRSQPQTDSQKLILAQSLDIQGQLQQERGQPQNALDSWTEARLLYQALDAKNKVIESDLNRSVVFQSLGMYPRACELLLGILNINSETCQVSPEALQSLKNQPISLENIRAINSLGHVLRVVGQLQQSEQILLLGLQAADTLNIPQQQAEIYLNLGNTSRTLANQPSLEEQEKTKFEKSALDYYQKVEFLAKSSEPKLQAKLNILSLLVSRKNWQEAENKWQELRPIMSSLGSNKTGINAEINAAESLMYLAAQSPNNNLLYSEVENILNAAKLQSKELGDPRLQAYALGAEGKLYEQQQKWDQAEKLTTEALQQAPAFQSPEIAYQLFWQLGRIRNAQGDISAATTHYKQAVNILGSLRGELVSLNPDVQFSFRESVEPVYRDFVGLLLKNESPSQENLKQARQTIESLQLAELDNFFRDACSQAKPRLIDEIDPTAAVIYPIVLKDKLEVILSIPGQPLKHYTTLKSKEELESAFKQSLFSMNKLSFTKERLAIAQQLYSWLIQPAEQDLTLNKIQTLVFVLDGYLRNISISTLHDGKQFLIEKYSLAITPGLQLIEPQPLAQVGLTAIVGALTDARQGFAALPAVASEMKEISGEITTNILLNQKFTSQELQKQVKDISSPIVHLATHGQFSSNAADTFILTWDEKVNVKEFDKLLRSRYEGKQKPIELLVLSACQTATGDERAALGLAGVAIRSGARSTLGTLWQVNDQSTAIFMAEFYRQLSEEKTSKALALRNAQLKLLENPKFQHPYFWAPFVLVGNWQ
jgi:CHAT domain-containing protein